jgi:hypothetical protein
MHSYNVLIINGKKPVGSVNNLMATSAKEASDEAISRYKKHWGIGANICLTSRVVENKPKVGDTLPVAS